MSKFPKVDNWFIINELNREVLIDLIKKSNEYAHFEHVSCAREYHDELMREVVKYIPQLLQAAVGYAEALDVLREIVKEIRAYQSPECDDEGSIGADLLKRADTVLKDTKGAADG